MSTCYLACRRVYSPEDLIDLLVHLELPIVSMSRESSEFLTEKNIPFSKASATTPSVSEEDVLIACMDSFSPTMDIHTHSLIRKACESNAFVLVRAEDYNSFDLSYNKSVLIERALRYCSAFDLRKSIQLSKQKHGQHFQVVSDTCGLFRAMKRVLLDQKAGGGDELYPAWTIGSAPGLDLGPSDLAREALADFTRQDIPPEPILYFSDGQCLLGNNQLVFTQFTTPYKGPLIVNTQGKFEFEDEDLCFHMLSKVDNLSELLLGCATQSLCLVQNIERKKTRVAIFGSTKGGSSLQFLLDALQDANSEFSSNVEIALIFSDKQDAGVFVRAPHVPHVFQSPADFPSRLAFDLQCLQTMREFAIDLIVLVGYMRIVSAELCNALPMLNVHPSLLPEFAGGMDLQVHEQVLANKRTKSGCTVHIVSPQVDAGPIVRQYSCDVFPDTDTKEMLKIRVQALEGPCLVDSIVDFCLQRGYFAPKLTYSQAGVSTARGDELVEQIKQACVATKRLGCTPNLGGYGALFDLHALQMKDPILVSGTDGVGTKLLLAQEYKMHKTIGIDLVAMSVNDLLVQGAEPLFFLDYFACGKLELNVASEVITGIARGCELSHCALIGGETAEMPGMYAANTYDLAGFALGTVERTELLPRVVQEGDVLIGLKSSGIHSNGFSLVRRILTGVDLLLPPPFPSTSTRLIDVLLEPTKVYYRDLKRVFPLVQALSHITGSGLPGNLPRVFNSAKLTAEVDLSAWEPPAVFTYLSHVGRVHMKEMLSTFNCGLGMVLFVRPENVQRVLDLLPDGEAMVVGKMIAREECQPVEFLHSNAFYQLEGGLDYSQAGVSISSGDELVELIKPCCKSTKRSGCMDVELGGFGALFDLNNKYEHPILVSGTDGVGTKLLLAQEFNMHRTIGIDLVAMSVNDLICQGAEPLFFLDYFACGKLDVHLCQQVVQGIADGCLLSECALVGGETAEMPGMYEGQEYDLGGFAVGAVEQSRVLPRLSDMKSGDLLVGLGSSGLHSNGYSLVRKVVATLPFISDELKLSLMEPTRVYWKQVRPVLHLVSALAHITGSGIPGNLPRVFDEKKFFAQVDLSAWTPSPLFHMLAKQGNIEPREMLHTFNCGVGMILIVSPDKLDEVLQLLGTDCLGVIGRLLDKANPQDESVSYIEEAHFLRQ